MKKLALAAALALTAAPALAHTGLGDASGFEHGFLHPLTGPDHLLAMLAVGLWSGFVLPHRAWAGAAAFLSAMATLAGKWPPARPLARLRHLVPRSFDRFHPPTDTIQCPEAT